MWVDASGGGTEGPFQHYDATPEAIEASAVELDRSYGNVEALSSDVDAAERPALTGVSGTIAGPMAEAPQPVRGNAREVMVAAMVAAGSVRVFGHAVQSFNSGVDALNAQWRDAIAGDFWVSPASYPAGASAAQQARIDETRADAVLDAKIALLKELELKHGALRDRLDAEADKSAAQLTEGPTDRVIQDLYAAGGLPSYIVAAFPHLKLEATTLPPDLANLSDEQLADYALQHPERAAELLPLLDVRTKQLIGEELARQGQDLGDDFDERQNGLKSEMDAFNKVLSAYGGAAVVATSFLNELGPRGLLALNGRIATSILGEPGRGPGQEATDDANSLASLQQTLGVVLAAGTSGQPSHQYWTGDGDETYVSAEWTDDLLEVGRQEITLINGTDDVYGYQLLAPMLTHGDHSSSFLGRVGADMVTFEQQFANEHDGTLPWETVSRPDGLRLDWTSGYKDGNPAGWDPMTGLMRALSNDSEASRDFFTGDMTVEESPRYPILDYLLTDREWMEDQTWVGQEQTNSGIGTVGDALEAATLHDPDSRSVDIVEAIVREYSLDEEAKGMENGDTSDETAENFMDQTLIDPDLVDELGNIAANYIGSFNLSLHPDDPTGAPGYLFDDAKFNDGHATRFLAELGKDPEMAGMLSGASRTYAAFDLDRQLATASPDAYPEIVDKVIRGTGAVTGVVDFGASAAIRTGYQFEDAQFNEGLERGFQLANAMTSMVKNLPPPVSIGLDALLNDVHEGMKHDHIGVANYETGQVITIGEDQQQEFMRRAIWNSIPADQLPPGFEPGVDPNAQIAGLPDEDPKVQAYEAWKNSDNKYAAMLTDLDAKQPYRNGYEAAQHKLQEW
jgi:hypothetical protein